MAEAIENKVSKSPLETIDLGDFAPDQDLTPFDLKDWLYQGLILKEQDFKQYVKEHEWSQYEGKLVHVFCSNDAIIPVWAYMTVASKIQPYAQKVYFGDSEAALNQVFKENIDQGVNPEDYQDGKIVLKGCGDKTIPNGAFVHLTQKIQPFVTSIMYGEPCSTVPVYKKPKKRASSVKSTSTEKES